MSSSHKHGVEVEVIARALKDPAFKQRLLSNPKEAIEEAFQCKLAAGVSIHVHEQKAQDIHLILPTVPNAAALSDQELRRVADTSSSNYTSHFFTGPACSC